VIRTLAAKTGKVLPGDRWNVHYVFFARQGFTAAAQEEARKMNARLVTLERMEADIQDWMKGRR